MTEIDNMSVLMTFGIPQVERSLMSSELWGLCVNFYEVTCAGLHGVHTDVGTVA